MNDKPLLPLLLFALIAWVAWFLLTEYQKRRERAAHERLEQQSIQIAQEKQARREAEEAERKHRAAETAAWRDEVAADIRRRNLEKEEARRLHQLERASRLEQERREKQAAERQKAEEVEARRVAENERARLRELDEIARRLTEEKYRRQRGTAAAARHLVEDERTSILAVPIAGDIQRDMHAFITAGQFFGEDHSPLAYVGYKVGKTHGLPVQERRRRLRACFQIDTPPQLANKYQTWGPPVTGQRFTSICQHIMMLANMRRERRNYEVAVSDWETDVDWFKAEYGNLAVRLRKVGIG
jgi:hypothetical protein